MFNEAREHLPEATFIEVARYTAGQVRLIPSVMLNVMEGWRVVKIIYGLALMYVRSVSSKLIFALLNIGREPIQTLVQAFSRRRTGSLNKPVSLAEGVETQLVSHLGG